MPVRAYPRLRGKGNKVMTPMKTFFAILAAGLILIVAHAFVGNWQVDRAFDKITEKVETVQKKVARENDEPDCTKPQKGMKYGGAKPTPNAVRAWNPIDKVCAWVY